MRKGIMRILVAGMASSGLSTVGIAGATASGTGPQAQQEEFQAAPKPGSQLWVARYNSPGNGYSGAMPVAVSPAGNSAFVTGGRVHDTFVGVLGKSRLAG
jgi:hypothetical protein